MKEEEKSELEAIINETLQDGVQADNSPLEAFSLWVVFPLFLLILGRIVGLIQSINSIIQYILWNANITPFIIAIILQAASIASAVLLLLKKKSGYWGIVATFQLAIIPGYMTGLWIRTTIGAILGILLITGILQIKKTGSKDGTCCSNPPCRQATPPVLKKSRQKEKADTLPGVPRPDMQWPQAFLKRDIPDGAVPKGRILPF